MNEEREYMRPSVSGFKVWVSIIGGAIILIPVVTLIVIMIMKAMPTIETIAPWVITIIALAVTGAIVYMVIFLPFAAKRHLDVSAEVKSLQARTLRANANNVYPVIYDADSNKMIQAVNGELPQSVPSHYSPSITNHNDVRELVKLLEQTQQKQLPQTTVKEIESHVPTFREALEKGLIGPGQKKMLLCHELLMDDQGMCVGYEPYQDELENNSTVFLGGASKSGKSTYMAHIGAQGALMNALYYCIDPHLMHPEKSVAKKLEALAHAFILPPARTESEIWHVLEHAKGVAEARKDGRDTPYGDRMIIFIVDEALAVLAQAHHTQNKEVILMYRDLALFLRDLGTQYAKFGVSGVIASQYVTKDAFRLPAPAGNVDFRDGCQNQILMRLPPNQAQAMRLIEAKELRGVRTLPQGHGYMGLYTGEVLRMASGNVVRQDIEYVATLAQPVPDLRKQYAVPTEYPTGTEKEPGSTTVRERENSDISQAKTRGIPLSSQDTRIYTGPLVSTVKPLVEGSEPGTASGTVGTGIAFKKRFTQEQEVQFLNLYRQQKSIKVAIAKMHVSYGDYQAYASFVVRQQARER